MKGRQHSRLLIRPPHDSHSETETRGRREGRPGPCASLPFSTPPAADVAASVWAPPQGSVPCFLHLGTSGSAFVDIFSLLSQTKLCWKLLDAMVSVYWLRWDLQEEGVVLVIYSCCEWGGLLERPSPGQGSLLANCLFCLVQAHAGKQNWGHFAQKRLAIRPSSWTLQIQFSHASSS